MREIRVCLDVVLEFGEGGLGDFFEGIEDHYRDCNWLCVMFPSRLRGESAGQAETEGKMRNFESDIEVLGDSHLRIRETIDMSGATGDFGYRFGRRFPLGRRDQAGQPWIINYKMIEATRAVQDASYKSVMAKHFR